MAGDAFNWKFSILIWISLTFVPKGVIDNKSALVWVMAWHRTGNKPLPEPILTQFLAHICGTRGVTVCVNSQGNVETEWWCRQKSRHSAGEPEHRLSISRGHISPNSLKTPNILLTRATYEVSFVSSKPDWNFAFAFAMLCAISWSAIRRGSISWWRHQMETFSTLLAICAGNSSVPGDFLAQRPVTRSFDVFFDLRLIKRLSKQSWGWWFETLSRPLWRHSNDYIPR